MKKPTLFDLIVKKWDESSHPRDDDGKFDNGGGGSSSESEPVV
jgi:hypothetical protein